MLFLGGELGLVKWFEAEEIALRGGEVIVGV